MRRFLSERRPKTMNTKRLIMLALGSLLLASPAFLAAQQDQSQGQESVADAAPKAQA
jgi:hypothetical protein